MPEQFSANSPTKSSVYLTVWVFLGLFAAVNAWSWQWPIFWDAILYARMGIFYQETGFTQLLLPAGLDAGHPPFFGLYLGLVWEILGRTLVATHLAVLPFVLGTVWQLWQLVKRFFPEQHWHFALLLPCLEPTWLTTAATTGNETVIVFGYLLAVNALLRQQRGWLFLGLLVMAACSLRGIVAVGGIALTELLWLLFFKDRKLTLKLLWPYALTGLAVASWLLFHYQKTGWLVSTPAEGWVAQRQLLGPAGIVRNAVIITWRILDFGRAFWWAAGFAAFLVLLKKGFTNWQPAKKLLLIAAVPLLVYSVFLLPFSNSIGPRYLLVCYLLFGLLASWLLLTAWHKTARFAAVSLVALALISGHFWIYPDPMAKGWDAHFAHLPYFEVRDQAIAYLRAHKINPAQVGTYFPNEHGTQYTNLDGSNWKFPYKDLNRQQYILISNVFNPPRPDVKTLQTASWKLLQTWQKGAVQMQLYQRQF